MKKMLFFLPNLYMKCNKRKFIHGIHVFNIVITGLPYMNNEYIYKLRSNFKINVHTGA